MIPKFVNIAGVQYTVTMEQSLVLKEGLIGSVSYGDSAIKLDSKTSETRKEQTFVHELLHAIFYEAGYEEQDEEMINRVGKVLYQVLKDNKLSFNGEPT